MNPPSRPLPVAGQEAVLRYGRADFDVVQGGDHVRCAVSGKPIPLDRLTYWSAELQEAYRRFREQDVKICYTVFHGISKSVYFNDPDGNMLEVYVNVPREEYRKSVPNPYSRYGSIDEELEGRVPQKEGTVAP